MGDEGEIWNEHREYSRKKRWDNHEKSIALLRQKGVRVVELDPITGFCRVGEFGEYDFWPTTGTFYNPKTAEKGRGVFNLIKRLKHD